MYLKKKLNNMTNYLLDSTKPTFATLAGVLAYGGNAAVWLDAIKGWAAVITVILGAPTALLVLIYWFMKVKREWKNRNKEKNDELL